MADLVAKIKLKDGSIIRCTKEHPVYTDKGWKTVENLNKDDKILKIEI